MQIKKIVPYIPIRTIVFIFVYWANSSYAPVARNVGFYCDDESIKQPFHGDTVHYMCLLTVLLGLFPCIIYITEVLSKKSKNEDDYRKCHFGLLLKNYYTGFLYLIGFIEFLKVSFNELRPHFLTTCQPDMENIQCSDGFITDFSCTGRGQLHFFGRDIYKSFPSGHSTLSAFSFIFLNMHLYFRMTHVPNTLICRLWFRSIPVITLFWTLTVCLSRIVDNRHFWWDVLVGSLIGVIAGFINVRMALKAAFQKKSISSTS